MAGITKKSEWPCLLGQFGLKNVSALSFVYIDQWVTVGSTEL